jgi:hypothetical protein
MADFAVGLGGSLAVASTAAPAATMKTVMAATARRHTMLSGKPRPSRS